MAEAAKIGRKRAERLRNLIDAINQNPGELRYKTLSAFAKGHNVSYETVKKDMMALSYAIMPSHRGYNLTHVPRSYRKDVKGIWGGMMSPMAKEEKKEKGITKRAFKNEGTIDTRAARSAVRAFLSHTPQIDKERVSEEFNFHKLMPRFYERNVDALDPIQQNIWRMQDEIAENLRRITEEAKGKQEEHVARKYSSAWVMMGKKLHMELDALKGAREKGKISSDFEMAKAIEKLWESNLYEIRASRDYEAFRNKLLEVLREGHKVQHSAKRMKLQSTPMSSMFFKTLRETPPPKEAKKDLISRLEWLKEVQNKALGMQDKALKTTNKTDASKRLRTDMKSLMRKYRPGGRGNIPVAMSDQIRLLSETYYNYPEAFNKALDKVPRDNFFRALVIEGRKISEADSNYNKAMEKRTELGRHSGKLYPRSIRKRLR